MCIRDSCNIPHISAKIESTMSKRVPSPAQSDASRQNGSKSQGPVTPDGKSRSSRNGIRHGFLANTVLLETESRDRFMALCADLDQHFEPATEIEAGLIETCLLYTSPFIAPNSFLR